MVVKQKAKQNKKSPSYSLKSSSIKGSNLTVSRSGVASETSSIFQRLQSDIAPNKSLVNLFLGLLIVLVAGILAFSYFKKDQADLGPAQQTSLTENNTPATKDVDASSLPGKYTVKEGDTLFAIADSYYKDGGQFDKIAEANKLSNSDDILVGQVLEIPKIEIASIAVSSGDTPAPNNTDLGTGGAINQTSWGEKITGDTYTVQADDWLSTIAGRKYGDIMAFDKIAQANNLSNPDLIEPGTVLKLP